jgi:hypothetical protein
VNVILDDARKVPTEVWYYAHDGGADKRPFTDVQHTDLIHAVAYSARTSHASYAEDGTHQACNSFGCIDDETADGGSSWRTWQDVRPVLAQSWYGFGGAWGTLGEREFTDTTGPLGPSPWKNPL